MCVWEPPDSPGRRLFGEESLPTPWWWDPVHGRRCEPACPGDEPGLAPVCLLLRETSMTEDCAISMSTEHGFREERDVNVVQSFRDALKQRVGDDAFQAWFSQGVTFAIDADGEPAVHDDVDPLADEQAVPADREPVARSAGEHGTKLVVRVRGQFALDRVRNKYMQEIRAAAYQACRCHVGVRVALDAAAPVQTDLPLEVSPSDAEDSKAGHKAPANQPTPRASSAGKRSRKSGPSPLQPPLPHLESSVHEAEPSSSANAEPATAAAMTAANFIAGACNKVAYTAMEMAFQSPAKASPLFVFGPTGSGKSHLLAAMARQFRSRHRMRRVVMLTAEQFTNDFINSVANSGITSFRRRYREVDALLIDDVQFLAAKRATLREMLYTMETLCSEQRSLVFTANQSPTEIPGLTRELSGRMASGLVCPLQPLDAVTRETLLRREIEQRCPLPVPESLVTELNGLVTGDGRVLQGVANLMNLLQRMYDRVPSLAELRRHGSELFRAARPHASLTSIEQAVCEAFGLPQDSLRASSQSRLVSEPRMLAMYLSRELTPAAYAEIGDHFGGRSHSTAIAANKNVQAWLKAGKSIGRGAATMSAQEAIERVETLLRVS